MSIEIPTQPLPEHVAEACAWLSAAERYCEPLQPTGLRDRATAAEALNILLDVDPPYPVIDTTRPAVPLAVGGAAGDLRPWSSLCGVTACTAINCAWDGRCGSFRRRTQNPRRDLARRPSRVPTPALAKR